MLVASLTPLAEAQLDLCLGAEIRLGRTAPPLPTIRRTPSPK